MTYLYRYYDAGGLPLYIGIADDFNQRHCAHKGKSEWFSQVASIKLERFETREQAREAEKAAILSERPRYNRNDTEPRRRRRLINFEPCGPVEKIIDAEVDPNNRGELVQFMQECVILAVGHKHPELVERYNLLKEEGAL